MKLLNTTWTLAIGIDLGALIVYLFEQYTPRFSTFLIGAVLIIMSVVLTLCTAQMRMNEMKPPKKKLPRRSSRGKLKVVKS